MFNTKRIEVKDFKLRTLGIIINRTLGVTYVIPRSVPFEIAYKKVTFFSNETFVLYFKDTQHQKEFLNEIGVTNAEK